MDWKELFIRAVKSGCICSIFYHVLMMLTGMAYVTMRSAAVFTVVFILLYFLWLVLVSAGAGRRK